MAALVLDASVMLAVALPDESQPLAEHALALTVRHGSLVPSHWMLEVGNGLLMAERRRRISSDIRGNALAQIASLPFEIDGRLRDVAWRGAMELAVAHGLTLYDGIYLELAVHSALPLATLDGKLAAAARKQNVALLTLPLLHR